MTDQSSLHINCGGKEANIGDAKYQADFEHRGASMFYQGQGWAFSSTGNFMDNNIDAEDYTTRNTSALSNVSGTDVELYTTARTSALSLTYYGLCLFKGNYTVRLHFAEIMFSNDSTFSSLGKRIFDVYIQVIDILVHIKNRLDFRFVVFIDEDPQMNVGQVGPEGLRYSK